MKAVRFEKYGDIDVLQVEDIERPQPKAGQVLIKVKARKYSYPYISQRYQKGQ